MRICLLTRSWQTCTENDMAKMTVYHGGYEPVEKPKIRIGRNTKDFGNGFYCTIIKEQAERWAKRYPKENDLFFTCSLIDYIARKTKNARKDVVNALGRERINKIYELADVYHSDNIDRVSDDFISEAGIEQGAFDNMGDCRYAIPSHWDIGKVYKRLIRQVAAESNINVVDALIAVYNSFISEKIDDYNSSVYYENPSYIYESYREGKVL